MANTEKRLILSEKCLNNRDLQLIEIEKCKRDPKYFFNTYLVTEKNDTFFSAWTPSVVPFILFPFQEEYVYELWESIVEWSKPVEERDPKILVNVFIEKSRQMGISWVTAWIMVYWFVHHQHKYTLISRTEAEVDSPWDMDSLFEKMRFMMANLPKWMRPDSYNKDLWKDKSNRKMNISNPDSNASITWKTANPWAWRWGTRNAVFLDEMAFMQYANQINRSVASNTPCRIFNSTPNGEGNEFYRMKLLAEKWEIKRLRYHWSDHPFYNKEWYENRIKGMTPEAIAQELEIDYNTAIAGRVYPEFKAESERIAYDPNKPLFYIIDNSHWWKDPHAVIVLQLDTSTHFWDIIDSIEMNCSITDMANFMACVPKMSLTDAQLEFLERHRTYNWKRATFVSDPYDTHTKIKDYHNDGTVIANEYRKVGINLVIPKIINTKAQIMQTRSNLYRLRYNDNCLDFASAIMNARYPESKEGSNSTSRSDKPVHDWTSHFRTALEYAVWYLLDNTLKKKKHLSDDRVMRDYRTWKLINSWKNR